MEQVLEQLPEARAGNAQIDHRQSLDEKNDAVFGEAAGAEKCSGNDQQFRQARQKKHRFSFAIFKNAVSEPDQYEKACDTDGGARKGNYTINDAFCKKKIKITARISAPAPTRTRSRAKFCLFFRLMLARHIE
jgi:hypothetical protein